MPTKVLKIRTPSHTNFINITREVKAFIEESSIKEGLCIIYVPHTTAAVFINEGADPDVVRDIAYKLNQLVEWNDPNYRHMEGNSAAHIKSTIIGNSRVIPIVDGKLVLGTWEAIFLAEFDGPRMRRVVVQIIGEK